MRVIAESSQNVSGKEEFLKTISSDERKAQNNACMLQHSASVLHHNASALPHNASILQHNPSVP